MNPHLEQLQKEAYAEIRKVYGEPVLVLEDLTDSLITRTWEAAIKALEEILPSEELDGDRSFIATDNPLDIYLKGNSSGKHFALQEVRKKINMLKS